MNTVQLLLIILFVLITLLGKSEASSIQATNTIASVRTFRLQFVFPTNITLDIGEKLSLKLENSLITSEELSKASFSSHCTLQNDEIIFIQSLPSAVIIILNTEQSHITDSIIHSTYTILNQNQNPIFSQKLQGSVLKYYYSTNCLWYSNFILSIHNSVQYLNLTFPNSDLIQNGTISLSLTQIQLISQQDLDSNTVNCTIIGSQILTPSCIVNNTSNKLIMPVSYLQQGSISIIFSNVISRQDNVNKTIDIQIFNGYDILSKQTLCQKQDDSIEHSQIHTGSDGCLTISLDNPSSWYFSSIQNLTITVKQIIDISYSINLPNGYQKLDNTTCVVKGDGNKCTILVDSDNITLKIDDAGIDETDVIYINNIMSPATQPSTNFSVSTGCGDTIPFTLTCDVNCQTCTSNKTECLSCYTNTYLFNSSCISKCPNTTYVNETQKICQNCSSNCNVCQNATSCTSCVTSFFLLNNTCLASCPNTTYGINGTCQNCSSNCNVCQNATSCTSCVTSFFLLNNTCLASCPNTTYGINGTCQNCSSNCNVCQNATSCTSCVTSFFLLNNTCLASCPNTTYGINGTCQNCSSNCNVCQNATSCTSCLTNYFFFNNQCYSTCPNGKYGDSSTGNCETCNTTCLTCSTKSTCDSCAEPYYLYQTTCIDSCPTATYSQNRTCRQCFSMCSTCTNSSKCESCVSGYYNINGSCYECPLTCAECTSYSVCTSCLNISGISMNNNFQCVSQCSQGQYLNGNTCETCGKSGCAYCSNNTFCLACSKNWYENQQNTCNSCPETCSTCYSSSICLSCQQGVQLQQNNICSGCTSSYVLYSNKCMRSPLTSFIIPLPFTIASLVLLLTCFIAKIVNKKTLFFVMYFSLNSLIEIASVVTFVVFLIFYHDYQIKQFDLMLTLIFCGIGFDLVLKIVQFILMKKLKIDYYYGKWAQNHTISRIVVSVLSVFGLRTFYFQFSRAFGSISLGAALDIILNFTFSKIILICSLISSSLIIAGCALEIVYTFDRSLRYPIFQLAVDCLIVTSLGLFASITLVANSKVILQRYESPQETSKNTVLGVTDRMSEMTRIDRPLNHTYAQQTDE